MTVTFDEDDWRDLTGPDKKALKTLGRVAPVGFELLAKMHGVGRASMDALIRKGLAMPGPISRIHGPTFGLTKKGSLAVDWLCGGRTRVYPGSDEAGT